MTHYKPEGNEPDLLQSPRERLPSRGISLLAFDYNRHYFHSAVRDSKRGDDSTKPAVHQIEGIVRNVKPAN